LTIFINIFLLVKKIKTSR